MEATATVDPVDYPAVGDDGAGAVRVAFFGIGDARLPADGPGGRVERNHVGVGGGHKDHVLPYGQGAQLPARAALEAAAVLPQRGAVGRVQRLHHVAGIAQEEDPVAHQGRLLAAPVLHPPRPGELQPVDVRGIDLVEWAVPPRTWVAAPVQPVGRGGIGQVGVGGGRRLGGTPGAGHAGRRFGDGADPARWRSGQRVRRVAGAGAAGGGRDDGGRGDVLSGPGCIAGRLVRSGLRPGRGIPWLGRGWIAGRPARGGDLRAHERNPSQRASVLPNDVRNHRGVLRVAQRLRSVFRHGRPDVLEQLADRLVPPRPEEAPAGEFGGLEVTAQVGQVAVRAGLAVHGFPRHGLLVGVGRDGARLGLLTGGRTGARGGGNGKRRNSHRQQQRSHSWRHKTPRPRRLRWVRILRMPPHGERCKAARRARERTRRGLGHVSLGPASDAAPADARRPPRRATPRGPHPS